MNRSSHRYIPQPAVRQLSQPASRSRHYGNRWGLWQHKPPAQRDHLPNSGWMRSVSLRD